MRGRFITFEGGDGTGKTTQMNMLAERLRAAGCDVVETVEPGATAAGNEIRRILLDATHLRIGSTTEMLLYFAARAQNVEENILPALRRGAVVLSDRFTDSTLAYQGGGRGISQDSIRRVHDFACGGLWPDLTVCLDVDPEAALARRHATAEVNRLDRESIDFHKRVRDAYLELAAREPDRIRIVDGRGSVEQVAARVWEVVSQHV